MSTPTSPTEDRATRYAEDVRDGALIAGPWVRAACARHLQDLEAGPARGLRYDPKAAEEAIRFFEEVLVLPEVGTQFLLQPWQGFVIGSMFGWKMRAGEQWVRRFRTLYLESAKSNGKSPLSAGIGLLAICEGEPQAQVFSAATSIDQAKVVWNDAEKMVAASPLLNRMVQRSVNNLFVRESGSFFRPLSAEHKGLDGKRVHCVLLDEVCDHQNDLVVSKMRAGTKGRRQPLIIETSNAGHDRESICWTHRQHSERVLLGTEVDDSWFAYVCALDEKDSWKDPAVWIKANPNLGVSCPVSYLEERVKEASQIPRALNHVLRLNFCQWTEIATRWLPMEDWDACNAPIDITRLSGQTCYAGLDLARTRDMCALCLVFPPAGDRSLWAVLWYFWLPKDRIRERSEVDHVDYESWARDGLLHLTEGNGTDLDAIRRKISGVYVTPAGVQQEEDCLMQKFNIAELAYDRYGANQLVTQLQGDGIECFPVGQGFLGISAAAKELERLVVGKLFTHGGNPIARWQAANAVILEDPAGNIKPNKAKSSAKIDGIAALCDALVRVIIAPPEEPYHSIFEDAPFTFSDRPVPVLDPAAPDPVAVVVAQPPASRKGGVFDHWAAPNAVVHCEGGSPKCRTWRERYETMCPACLQASREAAEVQR
jgi:phage terminase large subunit-like protein